MTNGKKLWIGFAVIGCFLGLLNILQYHRDYDLLAVEELRDEHKFYDQDLDVRISPFHRSVKFDAATTPVENMMKILQTIDSYNLCDENWYIEMNIVIQQMKDQYLYHHNSVDPYIQRLMELQLGVIQDMDLLVREADSDNVIKMEKSFEAYKAYYQSMYMDGGKTI